MNLKNSYRGRCAFVGELEKLKRDDSTHSPATRLGKFTHRFSSLSDEVKSKWAGRFLLACFWVASVEAAYGIGRILGMLDGAKVATDAAVKALNNMLK